MRKDLTPRQETVWRYLNAYHQGRARGVTHTDLAVALPEIPPRRIREALNALVVHHRKPIGSHPRYGVFVCIDAQDFARARQCLADEMWPTQQRDAVLEEIQREQHVWVSQATLFEERV